MAVDVSPVVAEILFQTVSVVLIGTSCLLVFVAIKAFRWLRLEALGGSISVAPLPALAESPLPDGPSANDGGFDYWNYSDHEVDQMIQRDLDALREFTYWQRAESHE